MDVRWKSLRAFRPSFSCQRNIPGYRHWRRYMILKWVIEESRLLWAADAMPDACQTLWDLVRVLFMNIGRIFCQRATEALMVRMNASICPVWLLKQSCMPTHWWLWIVLKYRFAEDGIHLANFDGKVNFIWKKSISVSFFTLFSFFSVFWQAEV